MQTAGKYVEMTDAERYAYVLQLAVLYVAEGASDPENSDEYYKKAIDILEKEMADGSLTSEQKSEMLIVLADVYSKVEDLDKAISILENLLYGSVVTEKAEAPEESFEIPAELTFEDIEDMLQNDMDNIQDKIDSGELDDDMGLYADVDYDENGEEVHYYDDSAFGTSEKTVIEDDNENTVEEEKVELTEEVREKVIFTLLTCYMAKDEFEKAQKLALILKDSSNKYYGYYGLYTEALTERKITGNSESANLKYAEAIAFFRNKTFADTKDVLASVFRARLYAEQGKFEKAEEIANLLADDDRASVMKYIAECKQ